jgi:predicted  nucleic acid-binding Zn-ribbon protein
MGAASFWTGWLRLPCHRLQAITQEEGSTAEERAQAEKALAARHAEIGEMTAVMEKEMAEQDELQKKIKAMESKVRSCDGLVLDP